MTFTFVPDLSTEIAQVRQYIGDTVDAGHLVEDETITAYLTSRGGVLPAAAQLCRDIAAQFARKVDLAVDGQSQRFGQLFEHYKQLAGQLDAQAQSAAAAVDTDTNPGPTFAGLQTFGSTAQEVIDARCDPTAATNAPKRWL